MRTLTRRPTRVFVAAVAVAALVGALVIATTPAFAEDPKPLSLCVKKLNGQLRMSSTCDVNEVRVEVVTTNIMEILLLTLKGSIEENNETKRFFLDKLAQQNEVNAALQSHISSLRSDITDMAVIVARVDSDDDGFPDVDDNCPTVWGVAPDGCPVH